MRHRKTIALLGMLAACGTTGPESPRPDTDPGSDPEPQAVTCDRQEDCASGETCLDGVCQIARCTDGPYTSSPPIPEQTILARDAEIALAFDSSVELRHPVGAAGRTLVGDAIVDVASARPSSDGGEVLFAARAGTGAVAALDGGPTIDVGFAPAAIAAGDTDRDGADEIVAVSATGDIAICGTDGCDHYGFEGSPGTLDVAVGDVDGDLRTEPVFLLEDPRQLVVWNPDSESTGEPAVVGIAAPEAADRIDAVDVDGSGVDAVVGVVDGGWLGLASDRLYLWSLLGGEAVELGRDERSDLVDVAAGDTDGDGVEELVAVAGDDALLYRDALGQATRIGGADGAVAAAFVDDDGDSARATLVDGPALILGNMLPVLVLELPPYDAEHSDGVSSLFAGTTETTTESLSDTVSMSVGTTFGWSGDIPVVAEGSITTTVSRSLDVTRGRGTVLTIGDRFSIQADPDEGDAWAAVVVSSACFHQYRYRIDDPNAQLGGADGELALLVPVDGTTTVLKSDRYNRMAEEIGLPTVEVGYQLGDPTSYPAQPSKPDGEPVPSEDMVFPEPPRYLVSDIANVGWWLSVGETESRSVTRSTSVDVAATVSLAGFELGGTIGGGTSTAHSISVGTDALFGGSVPPIRDLPDTDEDEHVAHRFGFSPLVYRRHYRDGDGNDAAFYVLSFTTSRP